MTERRSRLSWRRSKGTPATESATTATAGAGSRGEPPDAARLEIREERRRRRHVAGQLAANPAFLISAAVLVFWIVVAVIWPWLVPHDPYATDSQAILSGPSGTHWLGTDNLGRDVFSRLLAGARTVLVIAPISVALAMTVGTAIGLAAAYYRGVWDNVLMRTVDVLIALPALIVAVMILAALGSSLTVLILVIAILYTPMIGRTVRSAALAERTKDYVAAAQLRGERGPYIMVSEMLPNVSATVTVEGTMRLGYAVFTSATLSFLGLGLNPPSPDWGVTIAEQRANMQVAPFTVLGAALALASLVLAINFVADTLRVVLGKR